VPPVTTTTLSLKNSAINRGKCKKSWPAGSL
jgi:hypothetical protein